MMKNLRTYIKPTLTAIELDTVSIMMLGSIEPNWDEENEDNPQWGPNSVANPNNNVFNNTGIGRGKVFDDTIF